jgi:thymidine phosphorylase
MLTSIPRIGKKRAEKILQHSSIRDIILSTASDDFTEKQFANLYKAVCWKGE